MNRRVDKSSETKQTIVLICARARDQIAHAGKALTSLSLARAVREAKSEFPVSNECGQMWTLANSDIETIGRLVKQKLNVTSTSTVFESISEGHLKDAADMFLYTCPNPLKHWFIFYKDLLQNQSPDEIVLKLNRILKGGNSPESKYLKTIASGLFQRITTLFSLKYS